MQRRDVYKRQHKLHAVNLVAVFIGPAYDFLDNADAGIFGKVRHLGRCGGHIGYQLRLAVLVHVINAHGLAGPIFKGMSQTVVFRMVRVLGRNADN